MTNLDSSAAALSVAGSAAVVAPINSMSEGVAIAQIVVAGLIAITNIIVTFLIYKHNKPTTK